MEILIIDGAKYKIYKPKKESELEDMVKEHAKDIFGEDSLYFEKQKIKSRAGIGSIPDGYVLSTKERTWYILEIELSSHPLFEHIVPQMNKFINAVRNPETQKELTNAMYEDIKADLTKEAFIRTQIGSGEIYKFLSELVSNLPTIVIVIENRTKELKDVCDSLPTATKIVEFKTFEREGVGLKVHAHLFEPVYISPPTPPPPPPTKAWTEKEIKEYLHKRFKDQAKVHLTYLKVLLESNKPMHMDEIKRKVSEKLNREVTYGSYLGAMDSWSARIIRKLKKEPFIECVASRTYQVNEKYRKLLLKHFQQVSGY